MDNFFEEIRDYLNEANSDLKFKVNELDSIKIDFEFTPCFSYDYICLDTSKYSFLGDEIELEDFKSYFKRVNELSSKTIEELTDDSNHNMHFHIITDPTKELKSMLEGKFKVKINYKNIPPIGQFTLYKEKNKKPARVFFLIGNLGVFYILFLDLKHEIFNKTYK